MKFSNHDYFSRKHLTYIRITYACCGGYPIIWLKLSGKEESGKKINCVSMDSLTFLKTDLAQPLLSPILFTSMPINIA